MDMLHYLAHPGKCVKRVHHYYYSGSNGDHEMGPMHRPKSIRIPMQVIVSG